MNSGMRCRVGRKVDWTKPEGPIREVTLLGSIVSEMPSIAFVPL